MTVSPAVLLEPDATPLCRYVAKQLRVSRERGPGAFDQIVAGTVVALRSDSTAQAASITFAAGHVTVARGTDPRGDVVLEVNVDERIVASKSAATPEADSIGAHVLRLLDPAPPTWRAAVKHFWDVNAGTPGMPDVLVVTSESEGDEVVLGSGTTRYQLSGGSDDLALLLDGSLPLIAALSSGRVSVRGSLPQLSTIFGALMRVRFGD